MEPALADVVTVTRTRLLVACREQYRGISHLLPAAARLQVVPAGSRSTVMARA